MRYYMSLSTSFVQDCVQSPGITKIFNGILSSVRKHIVLKRNQLQLGAWYPTCDVSRYVVGNSTLKGANSLREGTRVNKETNARSVKSCEH